MPILTGNIISTAPSASIEATGTINLFMKCDTASSGFGLETIEVPAFLQGYTAPTGALNLFLEAKRQRNFFGTNLTEYYDYYRNNWEDISSTGFVSSGIVNNQMSMTVSGARILSKNAVMPMSVFVDATGSSSGFMTLYTLNQEVSTGEMTMFTKAHALSSSEMNLFIDSRNIAVSGIMPLVATGIGHSKSDMPLYVFGLFGS